MKYQTIHADLIGQNERLDAKYYLSSGVQASYTIEELKKLGLQCMPLNHLADIWSPLRFKSAYASSEEEKLSYLKPYDVFQYLPTATVYISATRTKNIQSYKLKRGTILQTCSGRNLGPSTTVDDYLSAFIIGADMIRIDIDDENLRFYVSAFLNSALGQSLLKQGKTGSVVDHLSRHHIGELEVPIVAKSIREDVSRMMKQGFELREKARLTLNKVLSDYEAILPKPKPNRFSKNGWSIQSTSLSDRLDAVYYDPAVNEVKQELLSQGGIPVRDVATVLKPKGRYKTVYVDSDHGRPILSGTQLLQNHPINLRYMAPRAFKDISNYELQETWTAYQADGRVERGLGTPSFITSERDGWLASGHVGRIIAKPNANPGWIYLAVSTWHVQVQIKSTASGSVVDATFPEDMENVILPPPNNVDGNLVCDMWEQFAIAKNLEHKAMELLTDEIKNLIGKGEKMDIQPIEPKEEDQEIKTEWAFRPALGFEIEPELTKDEFEDALSRISDPNQETSDPKKKGTSA